MTEDEKTELNMAIAREIWELPGVGWWRRKSKYSNDTPCHELCEKGESTPDCPEWKAHPGYNAGPGHEGFALPDAAGNLNQAVLVAAKLKPISFTLAFEYGYWRAVLGSKRGAINAEVKSGPEEAPSEAVARAALLMVQWMKSIHKPDGQPCSKCGYSDDNSGYHILKEIHCITEEGPCECGVWHKKEEHA